MFSLDGKTGSLWKLDYRKSMCVCRWSVEIIFLFLFTCKCSYFWSSTDCVEDKNIGFQRLLKGNGSIGIGILIIHYCITRYEWCSEIIAEELQAVVSDLDSDLSAVVEHCKVPVAECKGRAELQGSVFLMISWGAVCASCIFQLMVPMARKIPTGIRTHIWCALLFDGGVSFSS